MTEFTHILARADQGDPKAAEELLPLVYQELRRLAAHKMAQEAPGQTLQPTALVHEAWLRLGGNDNKKWDCRAHFLAAAAEAMRRILIDNARRKNAQKRGAGAERIDLDSAELAAGMDDSQLLRINDALEILAHDYPPCAELVKLRFFVGLTNEQAGQAMGVSERTAKRYWTFARAWLYNQLRPQPRGLPSPGRKMGAPGPFALAITHVWVKRRLIERAVMNKTKNALLTIFNQAAELTDAAERAAFLERACGDNAALRRKIEDLLQADEQAGNFLENPVAPVVKETITLAFPMTEKPGDRIGRYKLLEKVGEGGCGVVYVAEQEQPVRRRVALKVIKLGMDTREVIARFEAERQALELMDHPNIAKVLDAGATENGRPFFVMELVKGIPITRYCDENKLSTQERLGLFIQVCHAIQHAHQKGIIHRDLKPSNILVADHDGVAVPKVIDFGIAKATTDQRLTDKTLYTAIEQFIGTPAYMSPEQAKLSGLDVDTRSDIYSLGVLLYELLTGRTPFDAQELIKEGLDAIRRTIREVEPPRPSTRLSTLQGEALTATAKQHGTESMHLLKLIRGDLDWIVMKCLEKDRTRRYDTANGLAMDLKRHLENEPVVARPPSTAYRFQKAWRRNKTAFAAATLIAGVLLAATGISAWQAVRARRAEKAARESLGESEAVSKFLTEVFHSPANVRNERNVAIAETLGTAAKRLDTDLASQPRRRAALQAALADTYDSLSLFREAIPLQEKVRDFHLSADGREHPDTLKAMLSLAHSYDYAGRRDDALKLREEALPLSRKVNGPEHADTLSPMNELEQSYDVVGRHKEAIKLGEEVLRLSPKGNSPENRGTLWAMLNLANSYENVGRLNEAIKMLERGLALSRKVNGPEDALTINFMMPLAGYYQAAGRHDEAIKLAEELLPLPRKITGPDNPGTITVMGILAASWYSAGRYEDALKLREEELALRKKVSGPEHPDTAWAMASLGDSYYEAGRYAEAVALLDKACELEHVSTDHLLMLAAWQAWFGQDAIYEATRLRALQQAEGTDRTWTAAVAVKAACLLPSTNATLLAKALSLARRGVEMGKGDSALPQCQLALGLAEYRNGQYSVAEQTLAVAENTVVDRDDVKGTSRLFRAMSLFRLNRAEEARNLFSQAEAQMPPLPNDESKPFVHGRPFFHEAQSNPTCDDVLIWWLAYKEAKSTLDEPAPKQ